MSSPKFKAGEEVILVSREASEYNGEYIVEEIFSPLDTYTCRYTGVFLTSRSSQVCYRMEGLTPSRGRFEVLIGESSLRKKHQKGDMSFKNLMETLKFPEKISQC